MSRRKIEIMYFYSHLYENRRNLTRLCKDLNRDRRDIRVRLVNIEDPGNEEIAKLYDINMIPVMVFLTPEGNVAARRCMPLSSEDVIEEVTERISNGELPNHAVEEMRQSVADAFRSVTKRSELTQLITDQVLNDIQEADSMQELYELVGSHISAINHTMRDLENFKQALQKFSRKQPDFVA